MDKWAALTAMIEESQRILLLPHVNMDGDSVGSCKALALGLRSLGRQCFAYCDCDVPAYVGFLDGDVFVREVPYVADLAITVDCSDLSRLEGREEAFLSARRKACIDHHVCVPCAETAVVEPSAAACTMLVLELLHALGVDVTVEMAEAMYAGLITDTGCFRFSNSDPAAHRAAAELLSCGIDHDRIINAVYENKPLSQIRLESACIDRMTFFADGRAVLSYTTCEEMEALGATADQADTCIDRLREVGGIEIACFLKAKPGGVYKASLRSKSCASVRRIAERRGGGGHEMAGGCTLEMPLEEALGVIKAEILRELA